MNEPDEDTGAADQAATALFREMSRLAAGDPPEAPEAAPAVPEAEAEGAGEEVERDAEPFAATDSDDPPEQSREELLAALEAERTRRQAAEHAARSNAGRVAAYQRRIEALGRAGDISQIGDTLKQAEEEYPEVATPFREAVGKLSTAIQGIRDADVEEYRSLVMEQRQALDEARPDWLPTLRENHEAFRQWIEDQPKAVREAYQRNRQDIVDASETVAIIDGFKEWLGGASEPAPNERRQKQLDALAPSRAPRKPSAASQPSGDDEALFRHFSQELEKGA